MSGADEADREADRDAHPAPPPPADWPARTLAFWFDQHGKGDWFGGGPAFDAAVAAMLGPWREALRTQPVEAFLTDPATALAAIILFDQAPRNIHRGHAEAFATDHIALAIAERGVDAALDEGLGTDQRLFFYLPFEHAEDIDAQNRAVTLIGALGDAGYTDYALRHRAVIERWGRFPHRNAVLGRADRPGEAQAVADGATF